MSDDIQSKIEHIISKINQNTEIQITPETNFFDAGILDSFGMIEYISALEDKFKIRISNDDLIPQNLWNITTTINTINKYLERKQ
jgi:acyl carrier protein